MTAAAATASVTPRERILVALTRLAKAQGHAIASERMETLATDLEPYAWPAIIAALDTHRKANRFFPQFAELRAYLEPETRTAGLRGQTPTFRPHRIAGSASVVVFDPDTAYRFHCDHASTCATWQQHRALLLGNTEATLEALNEGWRARHESDERRSA